MENHSIAELLTAGQQPSTEERAHLREMGRFAAGLFARHLHGTERPPVNRVDFSHSWATNLSHNLSASTATRWTEGMGPMLADMLGDNWGSFWSVGADGRRGYAGLDVSSLLKVIELVDDAAPAPAVSDDDGSGHVRRGSLFGPRTAQRTLAQQQRQVRRPAAKDADPNVLRLADGSRMSMAVVEALEEAGLSVSDQFAPELPDTDTLASVPGLVFDRSGNPSRMGGTDSQPISSVVAFDGLTVDQRTPALASALQWAEAAYGDVGARFGPSTARRRMLETVQGVTARHALGAEPEARPVFGFFDSVEGSFLKLTSETPKVGAVPAQEEAAPTPATSLFAEAPTFGAASEGERGHASGGTPRLSQKAAVQTTLQRLVPQSRTNVVRPAGDGAFTGGRLGETQVRNEQPSAATQRQQRVRPFAGGRAGHAEGQRAASRAAAVTYRRDGRPQARVQRSSVSAPRFEVAASNEVGASNSAFTPSPWRLAADGGQDLPLGASLTAAEVLSGTVTRRRTAALGTSKFEEFRPLAAGTGQQRVAPTMDSALPGVSWVAMAEPSANGAFFAADEMGVPLATQPTTRPAAMVPSALALELAMPQLSAQRVDQIGAPASPATELGLSRAQELAGPGNAVLGSQAFSGLTSAGIIGDVSTRFGLLGDAPILGGDAAESGTALDTTSQRASDLASRFGTRPMARLGRGERTLLSVTAPADTDPVGPSELTESSPMAAVSLFSGDANSNAMISHGQQDPGLAPNAVQSQVFGTLGHAPRPEAVATMRAGHRALQRPVTTARESLAVQRMLTGGLGNQQDGRNALSDAVRSVERAVGSEAMAAMPALVRVLTQRQGSHELSGKTIGNGSLTTSLSGAVVELGKLAPARRRDVARQLKLAGFSTPELAILQLRQDGAIPTGVASDVADTQSGQSGSSIGDRALGASVMATVTRAARNLARVLTGTESMASRLTQVATPDTPITGGGQAVAASLSGINTMLETVGNDYFGALAPERVRAASPSLRAAIGDLLTLAKEAAVSVPAAERFIAAGGGESDTAVPSAAQPRILAQLAALESMVVSAESPLLAQANTLGVADTLGSTDDLGTEAPGIGAAPVLAEGYQRMVGQNVASASQLVQSARLEGRIAGALDVSTSGPAGADRLMGNLQTPRTAEAPRGLAFSPTLQRSAQAQAVQQPLAMSQVLAPEAMLGGMAGADLQMAAQSSDSRNSGRFGGPVGELMALESEGGIARAAEPTAAGPGASKSLFGRPDALAAMTPVQRLSHVLARRGLSGADQTTSGRRSLGSAGELVAGPEISAIQNSLQPIGSSQLMRGEAPVGPLAGLLANLDTSGGRTVEPKALSRLMGRLERKESIRVGGDAAVREFAVSWMKRVDGTMSGVDVGLAGEASDLRRFFGVKDTKLVDSEMAAKSPMKNADLVAPVAPSRASFGDRSGMQHVASAASKAPRGGAERAAKDALGSLNWNYVKTGSGASTTNANLSGLAATAASSGAAGSRVAFPLVAPAVKAVAQTALRSARSESMESGGGRVEGVHGDAGPGADAEAAPKLTRQALQKLAKNLAGPVAKILKRDQEDRRGKWA